MITSPSGPIMHKELFSSCCCSFFRHSRTGYGRNRPGPPVSNRGGPSSKQAVRACHGGDGKGAPESTTAFDRPDTFPDFTECDQTTPEDNRAWKSIIRDGGPRRGFSQIMPSFGGALTSEQIDAVVRYLRTFCKSEGWPRGELNLPRPLLTEKAFPESNPLSPRPSTRQADPASRTRS